MNRNVASLLFLAAAVLCAGCSDHPDSYGQAGSSGSPGSSGAPGSTGSGGGSTMPAPDTDLAAWVRVGMADPEDADAREVNDVNFVSDENPDAFHELF